MPVQKGKKKRRTRRVGSPATIATDAPGRGVAEPVKPAKRSAPPWFRIVIGLFMLGAGVYFFVTDRGSMSLGTRLIILGLYMLIAIVYLGTAIRGYLRGKV